MKHKPSQERELEALALADFAEHIGVAIKVETIFGPNGDCFAPPTQSFTVRVVSTPEDDLCHWNDEYLDPYWNVEVLDNCGVATPDWPWIYGPSYLLR